MRPTAEARSRGGQRKVVGDKEQWALFCKGWNQLWLRLQNGGKGQFLSFPHFLFIREGEDKRWVLGHSLILWLLPAGGGRHMFSGGVL
jgi:hypothetical protein